MSISDETLMAYADGELEPAQRAEIEAAMAADPKLAERVEQHRALRRKLNAAYDPVLLETARTLQVSRARTIVSVILPAALPMILAGMRVALGIGLVLVILAEMLAGEDGIGFRILDLERSFQIRDMFAWIVVLVALGGALTKLFDIAERRLVPWRGRS